MNSFLSFNIYQTFSGHERQTRVKVLIVRSNDCSLYEDRSNMSKFLIRPQTERLIWSEKKPQHCISIEPAFLYKPGGKGGHVWGVHEPLPNKTDRGAKELLYQCNNHWYYCGTYKISVVHTWENGKFFRKLDHQVNSIRSECFFNFHNLSGFYV